MPLPSGVNPPPTPRNPAQSNQLKPTLPHNGIPAPYLVCTILPHALLLNSNSLHFKANVDSIPGQTVLAWTTKEQGALVGAQESPGIQRTPYLNTSQRLPYILYLQSSASSLSTVSICTYTASKYTHNTHTHVHYTHTYIHTHTYTTHVQMYTHNIHVHTHTYTTHIQMYTQTHVHTHTLCVTHMLDFDL